MIVQNFIVKNFHLRYTIYNNILNNQTKMNKLKLKANENSLFKKQKRIITRRWTRTQKGSGRCAPSTLLRRLA